MFFHKKSVSQKIIDNAKILLKFAKKVLNYRKDLISESDSNQIISLIDEIKFSIKSKNIDKLQSLSKIIETQLVKNGGDIFPTKSIAENTEIFLLASIVALTFRTFFLQPFQIPTNSMAPTYLGMTSKVYTEQVNLSTVNKIKNKILYGASHFQIQAKYSGEIAVPLYCHKNKNGSFSFCAYYEIINSRKWLGLLPDQKRLYRLFIGSQVQEVIVPNDYNIDDVLLKTFFNSNSWNKVYENRASEFVLNKGMFVLNTNKSVKTNEQLISFDVLSGDMLFVDKVSFNFRNPQVGEAVVFRTDNIKMMDKNPKYYIKRLVGKSEDVLQVNQSELIINGIPANGSNVFMSEKNKEHGYGGYIADGSLCEGKTVTVEQDSYFMLGDNSANSFDSRFWGCVPEKSICGRPVFVFYPFNKRFGLHK